MVKTLSRVVSGFLIVLLIAACTSPEERAAAYLAEAERLYEAGDLTKAQLETKNALQIEPNNADARVLLASILEKDGDFQGVFNNLRIAVDVDPTRTDARIKLGALYAAAKMFPEAQVEVDAVLLQDPDNLDAQTLNARLYAQNGKPEEAEAILKDVLAADPAKSDALVLLVGITASRDPEAALVLLEEGMASVEDTRTLSILKIEILQRLNRTDEVEAEYRALINAYPEENAFRYRLAQYLLSEGRVDDVEQLLRDIVDADPESISARIALVQFLANVRGAESAEQTLLEFVNEAPEAYELQIALGRLYEAMQEPDKAKETYREVASLAGNSDEGLTAKNQLARMLISEEKIDEGRALIDEVLELDSGNMEALMMHGGLALVDGEYRDAVNDFRNVLRKEPEQERALYLLARTHLQAGDRVLAKDAYRRVIAVNPQNAVATMELAQILFADDEVRDAELLLRDRLKAVPDDARASQMLIGLLINQKNYQTAEAEARRLLATGDESGVAEYLLGGVLQVQGENEAALPHFAAALEAAPQSREALQGYTSALIQTKGQPAAEKFLKQRAEQYPDQLYAKTLLSQVQAGSGNMQAAEQTLKEALQKNEAWLPAYTGLASMQTDDINAQIEIFEEGMEAIPGNQQLGLLLGTAYEREGRIDEAIDMYEGLLQQNAEMPAVANNLAALLADHRQDKASFARAMELVESYKLGETDNPAFLDTAGWVNYRLGNHSEAVILLEQAVAAAGQVPVLRYHLGMAYLAVDNKFGAQEELGIAVNSAKSDFTGIETAREALAELQAGQ